MKKNYRIHKCFLVGNTIDIPVWAIEQMSAKEIQDKLIKKAQKAAAASLMRSGVEKSSIATIIRLMGRKAISPKMLDGIHASMTNCGVSVVA
jgi:hypothetical protein